MCRYCYNWHWKANIWNIPLVWHRLGCEMYFQLWTADRQDDSHRELYQLVLLIRPSRQQADDLWPHCCLGSNQLPLSHESLDSFVIVVIIAWWIDS